MKQFKNTKEYRYLYIKKISTNRLCLYKTKNDT